jgi:hypothetical protein
MFIQRICISSRVRADWLPPGGPSGLHENLEFRGFRPVQLLFSLLAITHPASHPWPMLNWRTRCP